MRTPARHAARRRPTAGLPLALALILAPAAHAAPAPRVAPAGSTTPRVAGPPLIPRAALFDNFERALPRVSPDGRHVSWLAPAENGVLNVWVRAVDSDSARPITREQKRPLGWYAWAGDSRHLLYVQDSDGDENHHLFSAHVETGVTRYLTPFPGVRAQNVLVSTSHPGHVLVALNQRDRRVFDMHRVDLATGAVTLEAQNPGDVLTWTTDWDFAIRAATAFDPASGRTLLRVRAARGAGRHRARTVHHKHTEPAGSNQACRRCCRIAGGCRRGLARRGRTVARHRR